MQTGCSQERGTRRVISVWMEPAAKLFQLTTCQVSKALSSQQASCEPAWLKVRRSGLLLILQTCIQFIFGLDLQEKVPVRDQTIKSAETHTHIKKNKNKKHPMLFTPLWKVPFDSLWISYDLLVFPFSPNMPERGSTEGWVQARWMDACHSCRISSWGALCPDREPSLPLTGRSFKAKRHGDRWHQSSRSHGRADLELHSSNVEGRVIELLLYYFSNK